MAARRFSIRIRRSAFRISFVSRLDVRARPTHLIRQFSSRPAWRPLFYEKLHLVRPLCGALSLLGLGPRFAARRAGSVPGRLRRHRHRCELRRARNREQGSGTREHAHESGQPLFRDRGRGRHPRSLRHRQSAKRSHLRHAQRGRRAGAGDSRHACADYRDRSRWRAEHPRQFRPQGGEIQNPRAGGRRQTRGRPRGDQQSLPEKRLHRREGDGGAGEQSGEGHGARGLHDQRGREGRGPRDSFRGEQGFQRSQTPQADEDEGENADRVLRQVRVNSTRRSCSRISTASASFTRTRVTSTSPSPRCGRNATPAGCAS